MKPTHRPFLLLPVACALLVGCSSSDDSPANETSAPAPGDNGSPTVLTKFDGTYLDSCQLSDEEAPSEGYEVVTGTIAGDTGTITVLNYTDDACTQPGSPAESVIQTSIVYPGGTVQTALGEADFVNVTPESVQYDGQAPTAEEMQQLNNAGAFDTTYDILLLDGSSLYSGDIDGDLNGVSEATRPNTLDSTPSIRQ